MLTGEVDLALAYSLVPTEESILPHQPAGAATKQVGIACWIAEGSSAGVMGSGTWPDFLKLLKEVLGILLDEWVTAG